MGRLALWGSPTAEQPRPILEFGNDGEQTYPDQNGRVGKEASYGFEYRGLIRELPHPDHVAPLRDCGIQKEGTCEHEPDSRN